MESKVSAVKNMSDHTVQCFQLQIWNLVLNIFFLHHCALAKTKLFPD